MSWRKLTDRHWQEISAVLPVRKKPRRKKDRKGGRPPADDRKCFEGILWVLRTGAPWEDLPGRYGKKSTVHRRLKEWISKGVFEKLWRTFLKQLQRKDRILWRECFMDGTFAAAKKGAPKSARPRKGREPSSWSSRTAGESLLESMLIRPRHPKSDSSTRRWRQFGSPVEIEVVPAADLSG